MIDRGGRMKICRTSNCSNLVENKASSTDKIHIFIPIHESELNGKTDYFKPNWGSTSRVFFVDGCFIPDGTYS
jgi:hypothetical protein